MAITNFLQTVWSTKINNNLRLEHILAQSDVVNREYQADTDNARQFHVHTLEDVAVTNYDESIDAPTYAQTHNISYKVLNDRRVTGEMDQIKIVPWIVEDISVMQSNAAYQGQMSQNAAYRISEAIEQFLASQLESGITDTDTTAVFQPKDLGNISGGRNFSSATTGYTLRDFGTTATGELSGGPGFLDAVVKAKVAMTKNGVPRTGRILIVPPEFQHTIWRSPTLQKDTESSEMRNANGWIGSFMGFDVFESTYTVDDASGSGATGVGSKIWCVATHPALYTFALQQPVQFEAMRSENRYGFAARAVAVYGGVYLNKVKTAVATDSSQAGKPGAVKILADARNQTQTIS